MRWLEGVGPIPLTIAGQYKILGDLVGTLGSGTVLAVVHYSPLKPELNYSDGFNR